MKKSDSRSAMHTSSAKTSVAMSILSSRFSNVRLPSASGSSLVTRSTSSPVVKRPCHVSSSSSISCISPPATKCPMRKLSECVSTTSTTT